MTHANDLINQYADLEYSLDWISMGDPAGRLDRYVVRPLTIPGSLRACVVGYVTDGLPEEDHRTSEDWGIAEWREFTSEAARDDYIAQEIAKGAQPSHVFVVDHMDNLTEDFTVAFSMDAPVEGYLPKDPGDTLPNCVAVVANGIEDPRRAVEEWLTVAAGRANSEGYRGVLSVVGETTSGGGVLDKEVRELESLYSSGELDIDYTFEDAHARMSEYVEDHLPQVQSFLVRKMADIGKTF